MVQDRAICDLAAKKDLNLKSVSALKQELFNLKNDPYAQHIIAELALELWFNKWFSKVS